MMAAINTRYGNVLMGRTLALQHDDAIVFDRSVPQLAKRVLEMETWTHTILAPAACATALGCL